MKKHYKVKDINLTKLKIYLKSKPIKRNERNTRHSTSSTSKR